MKTSRLHDASVLDLARGLVRRIRRLGDPLLRPLPASSRQSPHDPGDSPVAEVGRGSLSHEPMYGTRGHAERAFAQRAGMRFDAPALDARLLLLAALAAGCPHGRAHAVLDIGGSSGFHREQLLAVLGAATALSWAVVETPEFCAAAESLKPDDTRYFASVAAALSAGFLPTCVYANSSLQYFDDPIAVLDAVVGSGARALVVERTPMRCGPGAARAIQYLREHGAPERRTAICIAPVPTVLARLQAAGFATALYRERSAVFRLGREYVDVYSLLAVRTA